MVHRLISCAVVLLLVACGGPLIATAQTADQTEPSPSQSTRSGNSTEYPTPAPTEVLPTAVPTPVSGWQCLGFCSDNIGNYVRFLISTGSISPAGSKSKMRP